jgi:hypothetical protein
MNYDVTCLFNSNHLQAVIKPLSVNTMRSFLLAKFMHLWYKTIPAT